MSWDGRTGRWTCGAWHEPAAARDRNDRDDEDRDAGPDVSNRFGWRAGTPMTGWADRLSADERWNAVAYILRVADVTSSGGRGRGAVHQRCMTCHGATGADDGPSASSLSKLPPELGSFAWQAERSDSAIASAIKAGASGTAMPPARDLTDADVATMVAYVRTLAMKQPPRPTLAGRKGSDAIEASRDVKRLLDEALAAARAGRTVEAGDRAFDAYIAFEPLETPARAKQPGLVSSMERHFADFKGALRKRSECGRACARCDCAGFAEDCRATRPTAAAGPRSFSRS